MTSWVALLRGVNAGGITVRSTDLAELFTGLGFDSVRTVLASGNVAFEAAGGASARAKLKARIEKGLRERFEYDAWIVLVTEDELSAAVDAFPFDESDANRSRGSCSAWTRRRATNWRPRRGTWMPRPTRSRQARGSSTGTR